MELRGGTFTAVVLAAALSNLSGWAWSQTTGGAASPQVATPAAPSPFDKDDPEIAAIRKLNWKAADFGTLPAKGKCAALMALNRGLTNLGAEARVREELLIDYLDAKDLGPAYASAKSGIADPAPVTFEDLLKLAAAYVKSPEGVARVAGEFDDNSEVMLNRYLALYERNARREMEETRESRWQVRSMGLFVQEQGKLDDFKEWSLAEQKRRDEELSRQSAEQAAKQQQERQQRADAYAQQQQQQAQDRADRVAAQMEAALQQQQQSAASASSPPPAEYVDDGSTWGYGYPYAVNNVWYYNSNAYRGYVRDKSQDAYQRWRENHLLRNPGQLPAQPATARPLPTARPTPRPAGFRR